MGSADLDFNPIHIMGTETESVDGIFNGEKRRFATLWHFQTKLREVSFWKLSNAPRVEVEKESSGRSNLAFLCD